MTNVAMSFVEVKDIVNSNNNKVTFNRTRSLYNAVCICHHFLIFDVQF